MTREEVVAEFLALRQAYTELQGLATQPAVFADYALGTKIQAHLEAVHQILEELRAVRDEDATASAPAAGES